MERKLDLIAARRSEDATTELKDLRSQLRLEILNQQERDVEVMKVIPQERLQQRTVEQIRERTTDVPVPQTLEEIDEVMKFVFQERVLQHGAGQVLDVPVRQITDETIGVMKVVRPERVCEKIEELVDVPVPHIVEIILDVHVPKATDDTAAVVKHIPKERVQNCTREENASSTNSQGN